MPAKAFAGTQLPMRRRVVVLRANLLQKLGLGDRLELTRYAIRAGLIEP